jgi:hypothetical protein
VTDYLEQYKILHRQGNYGSSSEKLYDDILPLVKEINPYSILDYGCGQSKLIDILPCTLRYRYDPAILQFASRIIFPIDLVICIDVLEHIPENYILSTLRDIKSYNEKVIFDIGTQLATHILPNGRNAHCTVKPIEWWIDKLEEVFSKVIFVKNIREVKFLCKTW